MLSRLCRAWLFLLHVIGHPDFETEPDVVRGVPPCGAVSADEIVDDESGEVEVEDVPEVHSCFVEVSHEDLLDFYCGFVGLFGVHPSCRSWGG
jgi:hypothetical protein